MDNQVIVQQQRLSARGVNLDQRPLQELVMRVCVDVCVFVRVWLVDVFGMQHGSTRGNGG